MRVVEGRSLATVWSVGMGILLAHGQRTSSRVGDVLVLETPVCSVYNRPLERVLLDPVRDANPFFHLHEAVWMLAGRDDARWLDRFVSDFSERFAEDGGVMHGAYGRRWRDWFGRHVPYGSVPPHGTSEGMRWSEIDQLGEVIRLLRENPLDRQAVIQMWDAKSDLGVPGLKDRPCNTQIYVRCDRTVSGSGMDAAEAGRIDPATGRVHVLDMTVTCRSNDAVFGAYGANAVHFSVLQEYLAAMIGVRVGRYYQFSNNFHVYENSLDKYDLESAWRSANRTDELYETGEIAPARLVTDIATFDSECRLYCETLANDDRPDWHSFDFSNRIFSGTLGPMADAHYAWRQKNYDAALGYAESIDATDWRLACVEWLERRREKARQKAQERSPA